VSRSKAKRKVQSVVKVQLLLRKESRNREGIATVKKIATSLGIKPTASGTAAVSGELTPEAFETLFAQEVREVASRPPGGSDFGSPGGTASASLVVPEQLREHVESITVAPVHIRFSQTAPKPLD
jgi:hypothetical protein